MYITFWSVYHLLSTQKTLHQWLHVKLNPWTGFDKYSDLSSLINVDKRLALIHIQRLPCNRHIYRLISSNFFEQKQKLHHHETAVFDHRFFVTGRGGSLTHWVHCVGPPVLSLYILCWAYFIEPTVLAYCFYAYCVGPTVFSLLC